MSALKNSAALSAAAHAASYATRQGPLLTANVPAAITALGKMANQYVQLLDIVSQLAGPSLTPIGAPPAAPAAIVTCNVTHDALSVGDASGAPSVSTARMLSSRAGATPFIFLDRAVSNPVTLITTGSIPAFTLNGNVIPTGLYSAATGLFTNVLNTRVEIFTGDSAVSAVVPWGTFIANVAGPLLKTYQTQYELLYNRLRATALATADRSAAWLALSGVTPDVTQNMLDQLRVLRDPAGNPIYLPPAQVSAVRDQLITNVLLVNMSFAEAIEIGA